MLKVSVLIIAYNHERFIAQALDNVLNQNTNFDYEIIIAEDCSTDNTRDILLNYQRQHAEKIRLLFNDKNLGGHATFAKGFYACQGQYIALLDGDDYWISSEKLQKQVDFLDHHPECAICFHNALIVHEDHSQEDKTFFSNRLEEISAGEQLFLSNFLPTQSVMYRSGLITEIPSWLFKLRMGDWPLHLLQLQHGKLGYINDVMSVYRIHAAGAWSSMNPFQQIQATIKFLESINILFDYKYEHLIEQSIAQNYEYLVRLAQSPIQQQIQELQQSYQADSEQMQMQLWQGQLELEQYQSQLAQTQSELAQSQSLLAQTQNLLAQIQFSHAKI